MKDEFLPLLFSNTIPNYCHIPELFFQLLAGVLSTLGTVGNQTLQIAEPDNVSLAVVRASSTQAAFQAIMFIKWALGAVVTAISNLSVG
ncbi:MAG: hypothetical protein ACYDH1_12515 [Anaerolineaceae bacterium]